MTPKDWDRNEAAIKAAKAEILAAIAETNGKIEAGVTAQTKKFTEAVYGRANNIGVTVTGKGRIFVWIAGASTVVTLDGKQVVLDSVNRYSGAELYFEESVMVSTNSEQHYAHYVIQT